MHLMRHRTEHRFLRALVSPRVTASGGLESTATESSTGVGPPTVACAEGLVEFTQSPLPVVLNAQGSIYMDWEANAERYASDDVAAVLGDTLQVCL